MNKADEKRYTKDQVDLALMAKDLADVKDTVETMNKKLEAGYVTIDKHRILEVQVELLQKIVYGVVGLILTAVIGGMIAFYLNSPK